MAVWVFMLQWFRARARSVAATALLCLATLSVWSALPHPDDCYDTICAVVVPHDPSAHSVGRADRSSTDRPLHCVLCHWTRMVRPSATAAHHLTTPAVDRAVWFLVDAVVAPEAFVAAQPPLRGPPSSSALA
jgi:hypothetical protein